MTSAAILTVAEKAGYTQFAAALRAARYAELLNGPGPFTVFAPTDAAFAKFAQPSLDDLFEDDALLESVMGYHFIPGKVLAGRFAGKRFRAAMHAGGDLIIDGRGGGALRINGARVVAPDLQASNGVIHGIDAVLWPADAPTESAL